MNDNFFCLMRMGMPIPFEVRGFLVRSAQRMFRDDKHRLRFKSPDIEGVLATKFEPAQVAGFSGVRFRADFDGTFGTSFVEFILRTPRPEDMSGLILFEDMDTEEGMKLMYPDHTEN